MQNVRFSGHIKKIANQYDLICKTLSRTSKFSRSRPRRSRNNCIIFLAVARQKQTLVSPYVWLICSFFLCFERFQSIAPAFGKIHCVYAMYQSSSKHMWKESYFDKNCGFGMSKVTQLQTHGWGKLRTFCTCPSQRMHNCLRSRLRRSWLYLQAFYVLHIV